MPIVNFIQGIRHANPQDPRYGFLRYKAIRICVSEEVKTALIESGQVNGPLFTIPCGLNENQLPQPMEEDAKTYDICIAAQKNPNLGLQLKQALEQRDLTMDLLTTHLLRRDFLQRIHQAKVTIFLPLKAGEGFYLPALEGMALGTVVVCPDCIGNRSFCLPGYNCFRPEYRLDSILSAAKIALKLPLSQKQQMLAKAKQTASEHSLIQERNAFLAILENLHNLW